MTEKSVAMAKKLDEVTNGARLQRAIERKETR